MNEHDELFADADRWLERPTVGGQPLELIRDLTAALRAAVAARPQPDELRAIVTDLAALELCYRRMRRIELWHDYEALQRRARAAVAGSATPTEEGDDA